MITWEWESRGRGRALSGVVAAPSRDAARATIERRLREAGAESALARELRRDFDQPVPTGEAMLAQAADLRLTSYHWRDVHDPGLR